MKQFAKALTTLALIYLLPLGASAGEPNDQQGNKDPAMVRLAEALLEDALAIASIAEEVIDSGGSEFDSEGLETSLKSVNLIADKMIPDQERNPLAHTVQE